MEGKEMTAEDIAILLGKQGEQINGLVAAHEALAGENIKLKAQLAANTGIAPAAVKKEKPTIPTTPVTVGGKKYKAMVARFTLPSVKTDEKGNVIEHASPKTYTTEEVNSETSQDIIKAVLTIPGQNIYKEIV